VFVLGPECGTGGGEGGGMTPDAANAPIQNRENNPMHRK
jgi:hypothetical protein